MSHYDYISEVNKTAERLKAGETILYPTDTIWGIGCDATNDAAVDKVFNIKNRPTNKSCIVLFPTLKEALKYTAYPPDILYDLIVEYKSTPTTFIISHAIGLAEGAIAQDQTMAFRIPQHRFCIQLLKKFGKPILSTSANLSSMPSPSFFHEISDEIKERVDYIVDPEIPDESTRLPSRIIKIHPDNSIDIIR